MDKPLAENEGKNIVVMAGKWSPNIGNAFFNMGALYLCKKTVPYAHATFLSDQAAYWSLFPFRFRHEPKGRLKYNNYIKADYIVLQGSLLTRQFPRVWGEAFGHFTRKGVKVLLIGVGQFDYTEKEVAICREFLKKYPPYVFISRDSETYGNFHDLSENAFDGLDNAFFLGDIFRPVPHDLPPYVILNFDKTPEPWLAGGAEAASVFGPKGSEISSFEWRNEKWKVIFPKFRLRLSDYLGKAYNFLLGPLGLSGTEQDKVGDYLIVRTDHQANPVMLRRMFRGKNAFCDDIPESYLNLYAQTELTLSDRIHAVLVTLVYGRSAMLFSRSGRAKILERVGLSRVTQEPVTLDLPRLQEEKEAEIAFLQGITF